jgi:hydroxylamine dehydrogenase
MTPRVTLVVFALLFSPFALAARPQISDPGKPCLGCHGDSTPGIVEQWQSSAHAKSGIDCYSCHKAD